MAFVNCIGDSPPHISPYLSIELSSSRGSFSSSPFDSPRTVRSCKHCSFTFHGTDLAEEYCSKDCRICNTWYKHSQTIATSPKDSSPQKKDNVCLTNTEKKMKQHYYDIRNHSDTSNCYNETWRTANSKN